MRRNRVITFGILLILCVGLVLWQNRAHDRGGIAAPASGTLMVLRPAQRSLQAVGGWFADVGRTMFRRGDIVAENQRLQDRVAYLEGAQLRLQRYRQENIELRDLLKMPKPAGGTDVAADIVSMDMTDYVRRIIINAGSHQGVSDKDMVFTAHGVVGQVLGAARIGTAEVVLLTDRRSGVGAMTARTMAKGIVKGTGERTCTMTYLDFNADVREGDLVLTSGDSSMFPKGLIIGRVSKVEKDRAYSRMKATVDPSVPFERISSVWVRTRTGVAGR